ncbi:hypothetical protein [Flavisolibacter nicotianae]|uniref:hypothetical protein n=1 Tax=Flavisolibacter nicotianae TaxID=2364882 RepID=UPI0013C503CC|nr:hypothetical protein [Flavisolibacter nicotianae]
MNIVINVTKHDIWFCRICVASIRFYYPDVKIFLLKDELPGKFSTREIEETWSVHVIEYPVKRFGMSAAKIHFYCDQRFAGQRFLVLDSDIVFTGRLLDEKYVEDFNCDVIVSEETFSDPGSEWFKRTYFDCKQLKKYDPNYTYAGFTFNCGQIFCLGNFIKKETLAPYFSFNGSPSWKRLDVFPMHDQSVLNYLLPQLSKQGSIQLKGKDFMIWSETKKARGITLDAVKSGTHYPNLIHWAGALRTPLLVSMSNKEILLFFENYYYSKISFARLKRTIRKVNPGIKHLIKLLMLTLRDFPSKRRTLK